MKGKQHNTRSRGVNPNIGVAKQKRKENPSETSSEVNSGESQLTKSQQVTESKNTTKRNVQNAKKLKTASNEGKNQSEKLPKSHESINNSQLIKEPIIKKSSTNSGSHHMKLRKKTYSPTFFSGKREGQESAVKKSAVASLKEEVEEMDIERQQLSTAIAQIPSDEDFTAYKGMPASAENDDIPQDQQQRLIKVIGLIKEKSLLPIKTTSHALLENWRPLFEGIGQSQKGAKKLFDKIDTDDPIKKALLATHTKKYVRAIIDKCVNPELDFDEFADDDIHINNKTFEVLIKDIATTIDNSKNHNALFSIGLPTHHAYRDQAAGYCIFNKVAILIHYFAHANNVICGLDVNADDGLRDTLSTSELPKSRTILHLDSYDPRVYPYFNPAVDPSSDLKPIQGRYTYTPMHLNGKDNKRKKAADIHPVIEEMLNQINHACQNSKKNTAIYLVLGWDSHIKEKAGCSNDLFYKLDKKDNEMIYKKLSVGESKTQRFNDNDFEYFYTQLREIINKYEIPFLYISLEGGYTEDVNKQQTEMLIKNLIVPKVGLQEEAKDQERNEIVVGEHSML